MRLLELAVSDIASSGRANSGQERLDSAFDAEVVKGLRLGFRARVIALGGIAVWIAIQTPYPDFLILWFELGVFVFLGWVPYQYYRRGHRGSWPKFLFSAGDMALLVFVLTIPNPTAEVFYPEAFQLRFGNQIYFFLLIAVSVFYYRPRTVI